MNQIVELCLKREINIETNLTPKKEFYFINSQLNSTKMSEERLFVSTTSTPLPTINFLGTSRWPKKVREGGLPCAKLHIFVWKLLLLWLFLLFQGESKVHPALAGGVRALWVGEHPLWQMQYSICEYEHCDQGHCAFYPQMLKQSIFFSIPLTIITLASWI